MELQKAIRSGKLFRLPHHKMWIGVDKKTNIFYGMPESISSSAGTNWFTTTVKFTFQEGAGKAVIKKGDKKAKEWKFNFELPAFPIQLTPESVLSKKWELITGKK